MKIVVAGGSGFLGRALVGALAADGHEIVVLSRSAGTSGGAAHAAVAWTPDGSVGPWARALDGARAVVNLAGESIGKRWTAARKARIRDSRVRATRSLAAAVANASPPVPVFVSGSAVGYYGPRGDETISEDTAPGRGFLAEVCRAWEDEARRAASDRTRVVLIRTGLVLARDGGALAQMLLPFRLFVGGPVGSGRQYWPWIHRDDWVGLVRWAIERDEIAGAVNATAPHPETARAFARALGRALGRPSWLPTPAFALRLVLGEMADELLLSGQRAVPARAIRGGYRFRYEELPPALAAIFG